MGWCYFLFNALLIFKIVNKGHTMLKTVWKDETVCERFSSEGGFSQPVRQGRCRPRPRLDQGVSTSPWQGGGKEEEGGSRRAKTLTLSPLAGPKIADPNPKQSP